MRASEPTSESREWRQARRTAFVEKVLALFVQRPADLLSFDKCTKNCSWTTSATWVSMVCPWIRLWGAWREALKRR
jgi:hypothetical protein